MSNNVLAHVIDHHAHPFDLEPAPLDLHRVAIDVAEREGRDVGARHMPPMWRVLLEARLAIYLGVDERDRCLRGRRRAAITGLTFAICSPTPASAP